MRYLKNVLSKKATPQALPIPGAAQVPNSAGGYAFAVDDRGRLKRFLVLGSEGGSYYAAERALTRQNAEAVLRCIQNDGLQTVRTIVEISRAGRAPRDDPALFALALAAAEGDEPTRRAALSALPQVARTGTHLFRFAQSVDGLRGWGRGLRRAVAAWYADKDAETLAYQAVKYQQRDGWSHRDLLRLTHPKAADGAHQVLYRWAVRGEIDEAAPRLVHGFAALQKATDAAEGARLIREYALPREAVPTALLSERAIWRALVETGMPMTALIRNLATLTRVGLLDDGAMADAVCRQIADPQRLKAARVHPIALLSALRTYAQGRGARGQHAWTPVAKVVDALDAAFYAAFAHIEPNGRRWVLALDVSSSMSWGQIAGVPGLTPREASAAMALVTAATEPAHRIVAFGHEMVPVTLSPRQRLDEVLRSTEGIPFGGTDCALPMRWALKERVQADLFVIYTDSETWFGDLHPVQALRQYRERMGIPAKLAVVGMVSNGFTVADPDDAGMLDVVGFDTSTPALIADFAR